MKVGILVAAAALTSALAACSSEPACTPEVITKKSQELAAAIQQKIVADPASGQELMKKFQEVGAKYQGTNSSAQACQAYDDLLKSVK